MGTLYDLLGALPRDDAESLRTAFRKAAKPKHPDINPGDPDAALKFRELVRAYDILMDADQRTTYDELLTIALQPPASKSARIYGSIRKLASNTICGHDHFRFPDRWIRVVRSAPNGARRRRNRDRRTARSIRSG